MSSAIGKTYQSVACIGRYNHVIQFIVEVQSTQIVEWVDQGDISHSITYLFRGLSGLIPNESFISESFVLVSFLLPIGSLPTDEAAESVESWPGARYRVHKGAYLSAHTLGLRLTPDLLK